MNSCPDLLKDLKPELAKEFGIDGVSTAGAKLVLVTGPNASGKSLLRRYFSSALRKLGIECLHISQEGRATGGIERAFIYGAEDYQATSEISARSVMGAFRTSKAREHSHAIILDEPEIGLSDESQTGMAQFILEQVSEDTPLLLTVIIMTHSRVLISALKDMGACKFICLGGQYQTADEWLNREIKPISLADLREQSVSTYRRIADILNDKPPRL